MTIRTIFWDFDGTLIHKNEESFFSLKEALLLNHYTIEDCDIRAALRVALPWNTWEISYEYEAGEKWWDRLFLKLSNFYAHHSVLEVDMINSGYKKEYPIIQLLHAL